MWRSDHISHDVAAGQTGSFLNMAPEVVLGQRYNESAVSCGSTALLCAACRAVACLHGMFVRAASFQHPLRCRFALS